jgi:hypothetical protein
MRGESGPAEDATLIALAPVGRPRLIVQNDKGDGRELLLDRQQMSIGRDATCDLVFANRTVSRLHARIFERAGKRVLTAVAARHSTYVNGEAVVGERVLNDGDVIVFGNERVVYRSTETPSSPPSGFRPTQPVILGGLLAAVAIGLLVYLREGSQPVSMQREEGRPVAVASPMVAPPENAGVESAVVAAGSAPSAVANEPVPAAHDNPPVEHHEAAASPPQQKEPVAAVGEKEEPSGNREATLQKLMYQGDVAFLERRYLSPPEGSAVLAYREVLKLDPENERAKEQISRIIEDYLVWGEQALHEHDRRRARFYADKAEYIHREVPEVGDAAAIERRLVSLRR